MYILDYATRILGRWQLLAPVEQDEAGLAIRSTDGE